MHTKRYPISGQSNDLHETVSMLTKSKNSFVNLWRELSFDMRN